MTRATRRRPSRPPPCTTPAPTSSSSTWTSTSPSSRVPPGSGSGWTPAPAPTTTGPSGSTPGSPAPPTPAEPVRSESVDLAAELVTDLMAGPGVGPAGGLGGGQGAVAHRTAADRMVLQQVDHRSGGVHAVAAELTDQPPGAGLVLAEIHRWQTVFLRHAAALRATGSGSPGMWLPVWTGNHTRSVRTGAERERSGLPSTPRSGRGRPGRNLRRWLAT